MTRDESVDGVAGVEETEYSVGLSALVSVTATDAAFGLEEGLVDNDDAGPEISGSELPADLYVAIDPSPSFDEGWFVIPWDTESGCIDAMTPVCTRGLPLASMVVYVVVVASVLPTMMPISPRVLVVVRVVCVNIG
jgi:hypothetical protein